MYVCVGLCVCVCVCFMYVCMYECAKCFEHFYGLQRVNFVVLTKSHLTLMHTLHIYKTKHYIRI